MSFQMPVTIYHMIEGIHAARYVLPAIQREFVWDASQIEKLFDSLMRGYPIGSFLFWNVEPENVHSFQFYRFMDYFHQRDHRHNDPIEMMGANSVTAVLDGQQRLTALNIGLRGWYAEKLPYYRWNSNSAFPERKLCLNLAGPPPQGSEFAYEFRMLRDRDIQNAEGKHWFVVNKVLGFEKVVNAFNYCVQHGLTNSGSTYAHETLLELWQNIHERPLINYFLEKKQDLDKVLNIFIRVNSGGTQLSYSDMLLSIATAQWEGKDARKEIHELVDELNQIGQGFQFTKDLVLKACLVLSDIPAIEFQVNNFNRKNMLAIEEQWDGIGRALRLTVDLIASWGYSWQTLSSNNAVIPIAYYLYKKGNPQNFAQATAHQAERERIHRWLRVALLKRIFSGQSDSTLRTIRRVLQETPNLFPAEAITDALKQTRSMRFDQSDLDGLLAYKYGQGYTFIVLSLLYPWLKYDQHFHIDHIYPRSLFKPRELAKRGIPESQWPLWLDNVDNLANLQLLQGLPNQEKSDQEFEKWLHATNPTQAALQSYWEHHHIPAVDLTFKNFPQFLAERERMITNYLSSLLTVEPKQSAVGETERTTNS